jgi:hypothetical protein
LSGDDLESCTKDCQETSGERLAKSSLDHWASRPDIRAEARIMSIGRTIVVFVLAFSVAVLPVGGGIAAPAAAPAASELMASTHDCCDHDEMPINKMKDCQAAAGCVTKCFSVCGVVWSSPIAHPPLTGPALPFVAEAYHSQSASPPFRPPRV